jgi:hypothetical protein
MLIRVDLPAPFGPSSPNICPRGTSMLTPSSARLPPGIGLLEVADGDGGGHRPAHRGLRAQTEAIARSVPGR